MADSNPPQESQNIQLFLLGYGSEDPVVVVDDETLQGVNVIITQGDGRLEESQEGDVDCTGDNASEMDDGKVFDEMEGDSKDKVNESGEENKDESGEENKDESGEENKDESGEGDKDESVGDKDESGKEEKDDSGEDEKDDSGDDETDNSGDDETGNSGDEEKDNLESIDNVSKTLPTGRKRRGANAAFVGSGEKRSKSQKSPPKQRRPPGRPGSGKEQPPTVLRQNDLRAVATFINKGTDLLKRNRCQIFTKARFGAAQGAVGNPETWTIGSDFDLVTGEAVATSSAMTLEMMQQAFLNVMPRVRELINQPTPSTSRAAMNTPLFQSPLKLASRPAISDCQIGCCALAHLSREEATWIGCSTSIEECNYWMHIYCLGIPTATSDEILTWSKFYCPAHRTPFAPAQTPAALTAPAPATAAPDTAAPVTAAPATAAPATGAPAPVPKRIRAKRRLM